MATGSSLLPDQLQLGKVAEFIETLVIASCSRSTFATPADPGNAQRAVRLSTGPARHGLIGFPAPLALCGPQQYAKFGRGFDDVRDTKILSIPGFVGREQLPANLEVAIEHQAAAIRRANEGRDAPPVLVGYSSGGKFAHGMAAHLASVDAPVAAVVLLDAYPVGEALLTSQLESVVLELLNSPQWRGYLSDTRLTAMGWYMELVSQWPIEPITAPTLLVRAEEPMTESLSDGDDWKPNWPVPHDVVDVAGNHYSMLQEHAHATVAAVETWIVSTLE